MTASTSSPASNQLSVNSVFATNSWAAPMVSARSRSATSASADAMISAGVAKSGASESRPSASTTPTSAKGGGSPQLRLQPSASRSSLPQAANEISDDWADERSARSSMVASFDDRFS